MADISSIARERSQLLKQIFPKGVPAIWCPPLTHYERQGRIDGQRIAAHLSHMSQHVKGFLIPGSTGDGWELSQAEADELLELAFDLAQKLEFHLLIGALKSSAE